MRATFPAEFVSNNPDLRDVCSESCPGTYNTRRISELTDIRDRHFDIDLVPVPWHFRACPAVLRDVGTMLTVLNRNLALTTSALVITGNRALLISRPGKS